jgi:hydroxymethylpyrimidine pyrophosphatase-like HAD family hydrolase
MSDATFGWETRGGIGFDEVFIELAGGISELESGGQAGDPWSQSLYKLKVRRKGVFSVELQSEVAELLGNSLCEIATSGAPFVEITALGSHKGSGLEKTASTLGITAANTIVFGDNNNDIPMFRWAGHAVAMANALDTVHAEADAVALRNTDHGVAHYLEKLLDAGEL